MEARRTTGCVAAVRTDRCAKLIICLIQQWPTEPRIQICRIALLGRKKLSDWAGTLKIGKRLCLPAVSSPQPEPWIIGVRLIMLLVRSLPVGHPERPIVRQPEYLLQQLNLGYGLLDVHTVQLPCPTFDAEFNAGHPVSACSPSPIRRINLGGARGNTADARKDISAV